MMQAHSVPDVHTRDGLSVERMTAGSVALLGSGERTNQIELCAGIDNPANAAKNSIHFSKCSETIDIDGLQAGGLRQQFLVCHEFPRQRWARAQLNMDIPETRQKCELQPPEFSVSTADKTKFYQFAATPSEAPAATSSAPSRAVAGAAIPEAGECGFEWEIV